MHRARVQRPITFVAALTLMALTPVTLANADPAGQSDTKDAVSQSDMNGLNIQIDMSTVEDDTEVTVDSSGTIVASQEGQEMIVQQDGSWTIQEKVDPTPGAVALKWDAGACYGTFVNVYVNNEKDLQWGAQQICDSVQKRPHKVAVSLRQGPDRFLAKQVTKRTSQGKYSSLRTSNNYNYSPCKSTTKRRSSVVATPYAGGIQWPKVVSKDTVVNCNT